MFNARCQMPHHAIHSTTIMTHTNFNILIVMHSYVSAVMMMIDIKEEKKIK